MKPTFLAIVIMTFSAALTSGQQICPCVPVTQMWVVETCESWNCAASATIMANGDPYVLALPAATADGRWLVVKRVATGAYVPPADAAFAAEMFDGVDGALARFSAVAADHAPVLLSAPDGKFLVIMLKKPLPKKRAVKK